MRPIRSRRNGDVRRPAKALVLSIVAIAGLGTPATAQEGAIFDLRFKGIEHVTPAEKDRALYDALPWLAERLVEVPVEVALVSGDDPLEAARVAQGVDLAWQALTGGFGLIVAPGNGPLGYGAMTWTDPTGERDAGRFIDRTLGMLEPFGLATSMVNDTLALQTPFGPAPVTVSDDSAVLSIGFENAVPGDVQRFDLPDDVEPIFSLHTNVREILAPLAPLLQAQAPEIRQQLIASGAIGANAPIFDFAVGVDRDNLHVTTRGRDFRGFAAIQGFSPDVVFSQRDFRAIPRDATVAVAGPISLVQLLEARKALAEFEGEDPIREFEAQLGVDLNEAFLENFGPRFMFYQSDSTGGGGVLSSVFITELRDPDLFDDNVDTLLRFGNRLAAEEANGYVRVIERTIDRHTFKTLVFPGLPIPAEVSWTVEGDRLVVAATPVALVAALDQLKNPLSYLGSNPTFINAAATRMPREGIQSLSFIDNARFASKGYAFVGLALSGFANALRNPTDPTGREPGVLMPSFREFMDGIQPSLSFATWEGEDFVTHVTTDRSVLVNAAMLAGHDGVGLIAAGVGAALVPLLEE
ncbi:MAG: hypothetical protein AAGI53_09345 [Planctomycetota bacterium]